MEFHFLIERKNRQKNYDFIELGIWQRNILSKLKKIVLFQSSQQVAIIHF